MSDRDRDRDDSRGRDRDERGGRDRDRDDSRGSRDRDEPRSRDRDDSRDRGRDRDDDRGSRRGRSIEEAVAFRYKERDPEKAKHRAESGGSSSDPWFNKDVSIFKAAEGDNDIRPLPPTWDDAEHYGFEVWMHFGVGPDNAAYLCLNKMKGQPCPVCEERARVLDDKDPDQEYADELRPQKRVAAYIVDRAHEREGAQLWAISARMDSDFMLLQVDKKDGSVLNIDHPENGYDLSFHRKGQGLKTRYSGYQVARRSSPLDNDKALKFAVDHPIPDQLIYYSYDHIKRAFRGGAAPAPRDDDRGASRDRDGDSRSRDRDDRGGGRDRDERESRGRDRDNDSKRDDERARSSSKLSWEDVHELGFRDLCDLIKDERLKVDPDSTRDDAELADVICEELGIEKSRPGRDRDDSRDRGRDEPRGGGRTRAVLNDDKDEDSPRDRLRSMRERN